MLEPRRSLGGIEELLAVREAGQDDFTMSARPQGGPRGHGRRSSLDPTSPYARPVERRRAAGYEEGLGITRERYEHQGSWFELLSGPAPFDLETGRVFEDHRVFTETGAWIGADRPVPHRRLTNGALAALPGSELKELFERYAAGDYGKGECGFAVYEARNGARLYLVDEATRSLEGEPPLRDPKTTPGPQTLMLASEY